jgi:hypothetical protein
VILTTHIYLMPKLRICGDISISPLLLDGVVLN